MSHGLDVNVRNRNGDPIVGVGVEVVIDAYVCGGPLHTSTDNAGHAHFETADWLDDNREVTYIGKRWFGPFQFSEGVYSIHIQ